MRRKYTDDQLRQAVENSTSIRQVLKQLGLVEAGGNYAIVKRNIQRLNFSTAHFLGQGWKKNNRFPVVQARSLSQLLTPDSAVQSYTLKQRLFAEGMKEKRCESCGSTEWLNQPIPLEIHHRSGDSQDNRWENLPILCPNCHALTENFRGKKLAKCRDETAPF